MMCPEYHAGRFGGGEIRLMQLADVEKVVMIEREVFLFPWTKGNFDDSIRAGYHCFVLEQGEYMFGYSVMSIAASEAHLLTLGITATYQRQGWGRKILQHVILTARQRAARYLFLDVRESNSVAARLYEQTGFRQVGKRRGYYPAMAGREDSLVMKLIL